MRKLYLFLLSVIVAGTLFQSKAVDLYIRGAQFGWNAENCTAANKFTTTDNNVYKITLETLKSGFKIATLSSSGGWDDNYNYGSASNIEPGQEYTLTTAGNSGNITTKGGAELKNVTLTFTLSTKKLKVEGQAEEAKYPEALYMVGDFNGWNTSDANYKMTREGETGKYVIKNVNIATGKQVKFCAGSWDNNWGAAKDKDPMPIGTEFVPNYNANNYLLTEALTDATVEFYYNLDNIESAKVKVTNGGGVTPPEPTFPENLYVVGQVDGATKWAANHGVKLTKNGSVYSIESIKVEDAGEGSGYFGLATQLGATAESWDGATGLNGGDRYGAVAKDAPLVAGTPATIEKFPADVNASSANSWKVAAGTYSLSADLNAMTISIVKKDDPTPPEPEKYTIKFDNSVTKWESVSAYIFGGEYESAVWPGVAMTKESGDIWTVSIEKGTAAPTKVIFNDGNAEGAKQTSEFAFEDGKTYKAETKTITVKYNNGKTKWNKVYAYFWKEGAGDVGPAWHGTEMTLESGTIYTVSLQVLDLPTNVKFNDGADAESNAETFENGKTYGEGDDPTPPEPEYPELYVRGTMTDYNVKPEYKMTREGKVYTLKGIEIPAGAKFKISDNTDNWAINFGGTGVEGVLGEQTDELTNGTEKDAWFNSSVNFTVAKKLTNATVTFTYEGAKDGVANKIKVEGTEEVTPPEPEYPDLYVRGTMTDYNVKPEYKMTREGKVYTLKGIEIPAGAKFKISDNTDNWAINFGGTGVEGVEGEQTDELANGTEKNAWFNSSVNFTVAKKLTNATVTFTFEGAKTGVANKIKVEGTEVDDPQPENPDLYIIGLNNDWNNFPASNKFAHAEGTTVYTLELASMAAGTNFKFCPENWGGEGEHLYVFGAENADNGKITEAKLNTSINMKRSDTGSANFVTEPKLKNVKITLDINYDTQVYTMKLEGTVDTDPVTIPEHPEFYLVGTFAQSTTGGWDTMEDWKFTCDEATNTYTIEGKTFEADAQFKIAPKNWEYPEIVFGAATAEQAVTFGEAINLTKGNDASKNFKFAEKAENVKLVFKYVADGTSTLTVTKTSGIDGIESGIDTEAEYYNMQGVRVMNPEEGIYIVRRGNKVTKEIVRK